MASKPLAWEEGRVLKQQIENAESLPELKTALCAVVSALQALVER